MIEAIAFPFGAKFQTQILALMLRDRSFIPKRRHILDHKHFENPAYGFICKELLKFYDKYDVVCNEDSLNHILSEQKEEKLYKAVVSKLHKSDISNSEYISDTVTDFCTQQALRIALKLSEECLKTKEYDKVLPLIEKALLQNQDNLLDGFRLSESEDKIRNYLSEDYGRVTKLPTMITGVDKILRGGVSRATLNAIYAGTKIGKSIVLNNIDNAGVLQGYNVTHVTLEMGDVQTAVRSNMRLSGMSDRDLLGQDKKWLRSLRRTLSRGGDIYFKSFPNDSLTVKELGNFLDKLASIENYQTDLLVVDYLDCLKPDREYDKWIAQGRLAEQLRGLVVERNLFCWTATQGSKNAGDKETLNVGDVAGSAVKGHTFDSLWGLSRSKEEMECSPPRARFKNVLLREGHGMGSTVNVIFDPDTMFMGDLTEIDDVPF